MCTFFINQTYSDLFYNLVHMLSVSILNIKYLLKQKMSKIQLNNKVLNLTSQQI